jgi:hypothetical protein
MWKSGDFWRICDRCGFKFRSSQTIKTWDGLWVCSGDFESRHPQDFVRGTKDTITVPEPRPDSTTFIRGDAYILVDQAQFTSQDGGKFRVFELPAVDV